MFNFPPHLESTDDYVRTLVATLSPLEKYIYDIHPFDIGTEDGKAWFLREIDDEWLAWLDTTTLEDCLDVLAHLCLENSAVETARCPLSLQKLISTCKSLQLRSPAIPKPETVDECTRRGMGLKKLHEVNRLTALLHQVADAHDIDVIVDFGSGLGYLTHELSRKYPVIAIECDGDRTTGAQKRSQKMDARQKGMPASSNIVHVTEYLTLENAERILTQARLDGLPTREKPFTRFLLTGLHACGELSANTMPTLFKNTESIQALVSVGCCYHLMDTASFPKSALLKSLNVAFDKSAFKMACHTFVSFDRSRLIGVWRSQGKLVLKDGDSLSQNLHRIQQKLGLPLKTETEAELDMCLKRVALLGTIR
ncbi:hypothetical protein HDU91_005455, partial [Kappamyces sp. JEL0680]